MDKQQKTLQDGIIINKVNAPFEANQSEPLYGLGTTMLCTTKDGKKYITINGANSRDTEQSLTNAFALLSDKVTISVHIENSASTYYLQSNEINKVKNDLGVLHSLVGHEFELGFTTMFFSSPNHIRQHPGLKGKLFRAKPISINKRYIEQLSDMSSQEISCSFGYLCIPHGAILEGKDPIQGWEITIESNNQDIRTALAEDQEPDSYHDLKQHGKPLGYKRIVQDGKNGVMDSKGNIIVNYAYDCMPGNVDSLGHILVRNGKKWGMLHLDTQSNSCREVVPCEYDSITRFKYKDKKGNLYAQVRAGETSSLVDIHYTKHPMSAIDLKDNDVS